MKDSLCEIVVLLDRSGSMALIAGDMRGGFDLFVAAQKNSPGDCVLTLVQFDSQGIDTVHEALPIGKVPALALEPRGSTPLLDAIGQTVRNVGKRLAATAERDRPGKVLFLIITDGQENCSQEFKRDAIKKIIEEQQTRWKWQFVYLGANVDAFDEAGQMGIPAAAVSGYAPSAAGTKAMFGNLASNVSRVRATGVALCYSDAQRAAQGGDPLDASAPANQWQKTPSTAAQPTPK